MAAMEFPRRVTVTLPMPRCSPVSKSIAGMSETKSRGMKIRPLSSHRPLVARPSMMMREKRPNCSDTRIKRVDSKNGASQISPRGISNGTTGETLRAKCRPKPQTGRSRAATNSSCSSLKCQAQRTVMSAHSARHRSSISAVLACWQWRVC